MSAGHGGIAGESRGAALRMVFARAVTAAAVFLLALTLTLILLFLSGCGGDDSGQSGSTSADASSGSTSSRPTTPTRTIDAGERLSLDSSPPAQPVRLVFIHHSVGENWLDDSQGGLAAALMQNNYYVSDTNYGWGPPDADSGFENIGDHTDIGYWYNWFAGPNSPTYMKALYAESGQNTAAPYSRLASDPGGENEIVMFKSCFPNSNLGGSPGDPPAEGQNLLRGQGSGEAVHTVQNAKGIYNDLLEGFATEQDKLFIVVTAPPLIESETTPEAAANARAFNRWLVNDWLEDYPYQNVAVFDFYNVLTSNGGSPEVNDSGRSSGNHHRYSPELEAIEYVTGQGSDFSAYGSGDSHPTAAGGQKATDEFIEMLNISYHAWKSG
ncbi:MAG: hypothetical protein HZB44_04185 [Actinobacteria bacterium]|nr:hypothetical protein [Actinomycetota bacterium]